MKTINTSPGNLIHYRNRDWMVLPSDDKDLIKIKPLGGSEEETTAIFLPLAIKSEGFKEAKFPYPKPTELGAFETAKLLYDAARISFRNTAGPFRCMGKLSFRPRAYQLVPLVMALQQDIVRLMIADDVGIGKTIEALLILKELMERGEIKRFAVICPPHLCEQWQTELKEKLDINAEIIRSSTAAKLDRQITDDRGPFYHVAYQVISIDYVKAEKRKGIFVNDCPEFVIIDEAHTCSLPANAISKYQQQRFSLLSDLAANENRHLVLLTATPHSGKDDEFTSLLGLLKPKFKELNFEQLEQSERKKLSKHFIQRKRENISRWLQEDTTFPNRETLEIGYQLSHEYKDFYNQLIQFGRTISAVQSNNKQTELLRSWAAISLIKGAMSSPLMAVEMLHRRREKYNTTNGDELDIPDETNTLFESLEDNNDLPRQDLIEHLDLKQSEIKQLNDLLSSAQNLSSGKHDIKLQTTLHHVSNWIKNGYYPIVFCHYVATAHYVAKYLKENLPNNIHIEAITSELADEQRRERTELMGQASKRLLVATDCLSEGINLQEYFTAVLHYDLPWNPNRLEQRIGRVDRFGQSAIEIKNYLLYGTDNEMDNFVLEILIKKILDIKKSIGVSINISENSKGIMAEATKRILFAQDKNQPIQQSLFTETDNTITNEIEAARKKGENLRSIFAHESINPEHIKKDLAEVDEAIGNVQAVEKLVQLGITYLKGTCIKDAKGYIVQMQNLPKHLQQSFRGKFGNKISFESPTPKGYQYIGRNHVFVEQLCHFLLAIAFEPNKEYGSLARVCEIQTDAVDTKTTLVMFRVRNVIREVKTKREAVAEEMHLYGYTNNSKLSFEEAKHILQTATPLSNLSAERQQNSITEALQGFALREADFIQLATERADKLVEAQQRFKALVGGSRYEKSTPVLPPDIMGVYILTPKPTAL